MILANELNIDPIDIAIRIHRFYLLSMNNALHQLNYHHLFYFWLTASQGSVTEAANMIRVAQPTVSAQLRELETTLGERLFERSGRRLHLTEVGKVVFQ